MHNSRQNNYLNYNDLNQAKNKLSIELNLKNLRT